MLSNRNTPRALWEPGEGACWGHRNHARREPVPISCSSWKGVLHLPQTVLETVSSSSPGLPHLLTKLGGRWIHYLSISEAALLRWDRVEEGREGRSCGKARALSQVCPLPALAARAPLPLAKSQKIPGHPRVPHPAPPTCPLFPECLARLSVVTALGQGRSCYSLSHLISRYC